VEDDDHTADHQAGNDTLQIFFFRHGHSTWNAASEEGLHAKVKNLFEQDAPLDPLGIKQSLYVGIQHLLSPAPEAEADAKLRARLCSAVLDPRTPILTSNLHRAIDTALLTLLPFMLMHPEAFPKDRQLQVMSDLQEISVGYDAMPEQQHYKPEDHQDLHKFDALTPFEDDQFRELYSQGRPGFWNEIHKLVTTAYKQGRVNGAKNFGDANHNAKHVLGVKRQEVMMGLAETFFNMSSPSQQLLIFGHSMWLRTMCQLFGSDKCVWYKENLINNCGLVEMWLEKVEGEYKITKVVPQYEAGYLGWNRKCTDEQVSKVESFEEMQEFHELLGADAFSNPAEVPRSSETRKEDGASPSASPKGEATLTI